MVKRDYWHILWFVLLGLICFALGYTVCWNDANEYWGRIYQEDIEAIRQEVSEKYGLKEIPMLEIYVHDLVGADTE